MAQTTSEILVGADGSIHVAPVGSTLPTSPIAAYDGAFAELGFASPDGVKVHDGKTLQEINVWQSFYAVRRIITAREFTATFQLAQWNADTVALAFGGGEVTTVSGGFKYTPPDPATLDERALGVDWADGNKHYRLVIPRGIVQDAVDTEVTRSNNAVLPIVFGVITDGTTDPWYLLTDDPSFS